MDQEFRLRQLLRSNPELDQAALCEQMRAQGVQISQSTLSRMLKRLGYLKREGLWTHLSGDTDIQAAVQPVPPNLIVLKTKAGFANALAVQLDREPLPGQAGTVAGDDTVFVAVAGGLDAALSAARLRFGR